MLCMDRSASQLVKISSPETRPLVVQVPKIQVHLGDPSAGA